MTIQEAIDRADGLKPNQYSEDEKVRWLSELDANVFNDVIRLHQFNPGETEITEFNGYTSDDTNKVLLAGFPYDEMYIAYIKMKIDEENQETARYNNSATLFNSYYENFTKHYNLTHMPINRNKFRIW